MVAPIQIVGRRGKSSPIYFEFDEKSVARAKRKMQRASGKALYTKLQRANLALGDELANKIQRTAPRSSGTLRKSVKARPERSRWMVSFAGGKFRARQGRSTTVLVGPTAPHRHLVIRGTKERPSSHYGFTGGGSEPRRYGSFSRKGSRYAAFNGDVVFRSPKWGTGRMTPNPFVDRAAKGFHRKAAQRMKQMWGGLLR